MTDTATEVVDDAIPVPVKWQGITPFVVLIAVVVLGDFLLWWHFPVLSFALFLTALVGAHLMLHIHRMSRLQVFWGLVAHGIGILPLLETMNILTFLSGVSGTLAACLIFQGSMMRGWPARLDVFLTSALLSPTRFWVFLFGSRHHVKISGEAARGARNWVFPVLLAAGFVFLFASANPVWETWLRKIDVFAFLSTFFSARSLFWLVVAWFAWPFVEPLAPVRKLFASMRKNADPSFSSAGGEPQPALGDDFFERCLILFNLVFAAQTLLDVTYLWGGFELPEGMTYASYAHRGAYPLVAAAIMAGIFVLIAMRPGGPGERVVRIKWLVLAWVVQNLVLVASSVFRLEIYIEAYALTYWRIAALIWMGLVAAGLILIVVRFLLGRSTGWLITANAFALAATLYATSLLNFPNVIASYNLDHGHENQAAAELRYDDGYIVSLGALALPALMEFREGKPDLSEKEQGWLARSERLLRRQVDYEVGTNWRTWSFRGQRLKWFLEARRSATQVLSNPSVPEPTFP